MSVNSLYTMPLISGDVAQAVQIRLHLLSLIPRATTFP